MHLNWLKELVTFILIISVFKVELNTLYPSETVHESKFLLKTYYYDGLFCDFTRNLTLLLETFFSRYLLLFVFFLETFYPSRFGEYLR